MAEPEETSKHVSVAKSEQRDAHGHFVSSPGRSSSAPDEQTTPPSSSPHPVINTLFPHNVAVEKSTDDDTLLDVHLGNPLRKITELLEEIKQQKAFSFTLKGSLGIMGVVLALSTLGIFGGSKMLCAKGIQSEVGTVRVLQATEAITSIPVITPVVNLYQYIVFHKSPPSPVQRVILVQQDTSTVQLLGNLVFGQYDKQQVIATGDYDSCSRVLKVANASSIEPVQPAQSVPNQLFPLLFH